MKRVVVLGPGGAGKSTFAAQLGQAKELPVIELDKLFWTADLLAPRSPDEWAAIQEGLVAEPAWILDGDLGPYDVLHHRLAAADTIIVLDFARWRCGWRALRRSREEIDFWRWLWAWRREYRPLLMAAIVEHAGGADVYVLRSTRDLDRLAASHGVPGYSRTGRATNVRF